MIPESTSAVILAAGRGSRLGPDGAPGPKCLTRIGGQRLIDSQIKALSRIGIQEVAVVGGYCIDRLRGGDYILLENSEWKSTSMVESIKIGLRHQEPTRDTVVVYGDVYLDADALIQMTELQCDLAVGYTLGWLANWCGRYIDPLDDLETFRLDGHGRVIDIGGKPFTTDEIEGQFAGVLFMSSEGRSRLRSLLEVTSVSSTTELVSTCIARGEDVQSFIVFEPWFEIDTERDVLFAQSSLEGQGS